MILVQGISAKYGQVSAISDVSLEIKQGEIVSLIGTNGAGKSSTLKCIAGVLPLHAGKIQFENQNISNLSPHKRIRNGICLVPEGRQLFGQMTVFENLELGYSGGRKVGSIQEQMEKVFEIFPKVEQRSKQLAGTLSGGEQQMVAIARGLMAFPKILMLDEPTMGLSPIMVESVAETIQRLHDEGMTILLVEQNAVMALELSSRAYVLETGNVLLNGLSTDLLSDKEVQRAYLGR